ncbi:hypothetical protein I317_06728 [Kwoniella heveanensis CBS 569]|nr:hypothetical protein I317_06728 [Kwoniella heveanensis CBS 569]
MKVLIGFCITCAVFIIPPTLRLLLPFLFGTVPRFVLRIWLFFASREVVVDFKIVEKLDGVPVVHDSVTYAQHLISSNGYTAKLYGVALNIANKSYEVATPVLVRTKPLLESADGLAVATFDRAEATFPYPFKTPTQDLMVVKQAKAVYDDNTQPVIQDVLNKTAAINSAIGARASATIHTSQDIAHALVEQLKHLAEHGKEIPGALIDGVGKATGDIKGIVFAKETSVQEKSNKLTAYVVDQAKPIIDEIYNFVNSAKIKAEEEARKAAEVANGTTQNTSS